MIKKPVIVILLSILSISLSAQELQIHKEFQNAIEKGTRTLDGKPGGSYWINHSDYDLDVEVTFENDTVWISGSAIITYYNESPDDLNMILLRSYPDIFAAGAKRDFYFGSSNDTKLVQYSDLYINNDTVPSSLLMTILTNAGQTIPYRNS